MNLNMMTWSHQNKKIDTNKTKQQTTSTNAEN